MIARGLLGSLLVALGGLVTEVLPWSSPVATHPFLEPLRSSDEGRTIGLVLTTTGVALLAVAWLQLLARPRSVHLATAAWSLPLLLAPPLFSRDGWSYAAQGVLTHIGLSPYVWTPSIFEGQLREGVDPIWMWSPAPYGPVPLGWGSLVAGVTENPWLMVVGYRVLALLGLVLLAWAVPRLARAAGTDPDRAAAVVLASPLTIVHGVGGVHNDVVMAALMAAALAVALDGRWVVGAGLAGAAAAVKVPGGAVAIGVALASLAPLTGLLPRVRRLVTVALVALAVVVASGVAIGVGIGWVHALGTPGKVHTPLSVTTQLGGLVGQVTVLRTLGLGLALGYAAWVALRGRTGDPSYAVRAVALATTALAVLSPAVHAWYLLWALPFLAAVHWSRPVQQLVLAAALGLGVVAPLDGSMLALRAELLVLVVLAALTWARLRQTAARALPAPRARPASPPPSATRETAPPGPGHPHD